MKMLGNYGNCDCCRPDKGTIRNREERQWMQDYKEEMEDNEKD